MLVHWDGMKRRRPEIFDALEIKWMAPSVGNLAFMAESHVPVAHVDAIGGALFELGKTGAGRATLSPIGCPSVEPANSRTFDPVRHALAEYTRYFGKLAEMKETPK